MVYKGTVKGGTVVLEDGVSLPEGTPVKVEPLDELPTWGEVLKDVIGKAEGLPSDMASNHDVRFAPRIRGNGAR